MYSGCTILTGVIHHFFAAESRLARQNRASTGPFREGNVQHSLWMLSQGPRLQGSGSASIWSSEVPEGGNKKHSFRGKGLDRTARLLFRNVECMESYRGIRWNSYYSQESWYYQQTYLRRQRRWLSRRSTGREQWTRYMKHPTCYYRCSLVFEFCNCGSILLQKLGLK